MRQTRQKKIVKTYKSDDHGVLLIVKRCRRQYYNKCEFTRRFPNRKCGDRVTTKEEF